MVKDLRSYIKDTEAAGNLYKVSKEVDPEANVGALCAESDKTILFDNVKGYPGWQVVANLVNNRDSEMVVFGAERREDVVKHMAAALDRGPSEHIVVDSSPVQQVVLDGDDATLDRLPVAQHSELDGGPYIGSAIGIVVDPETGKHNTTWPRMMKADGRECPFMIFSPHVNQIYAKYAQMGKPMPMALSIGHHPAVDIAASTSLHHPHCGELDYVASIQGEPFEFVKCGTIDVEVPASAEIIVEGETILNHVQTEGPFGNYLGTYSTGPISRDGVQKGPVLRIKRITMREDAIYRHLQATVWTEHQRLVMLPIEATLFTALKEMGIDVHDVYIPSWGGASMTIIQMSPRGPGEVQDALMKAAMWENTTLGFMSQVVIAVNRDVNIYDARDVMWALAIRTLWTKGTTIVPGTRSSPIMPGADKLPGLPYRLAGKAMIDATLLPPRNDDEWWEYARAWPKGHGKVKLEDFVDNLNGGTPLQMVRNASHEDMMAMKPGGVRPEA